MENHSLIKFYLNDQLFKAKRMNIYENLSKVRQILGIHLPEKALFIFSDKTFIDKEDELNIKLNEIIDINNVYLINKDNYDNNIKKIFPFQMQNPTIESNFPEWLQDKNENKKINSENKENIKNSEKNNEEDNSILVNIKKSDFKYIPSPVKYSNPKIMDFQIQKDDNSKTKINEKNNEKTKYIGRKFPSISSSKKVGKIEDLDIYLYPSFHFHSFEEYKALSFMVVGETGSGKTTLLNSFVNVLLGVNIEDNYRYKIIVENTNKSQANSQTNQVRIYNIRSIGRYPPVKIIDTPGFGDTEGIETDKKIVQQIETFFRENLNTINAICFVTKSTNNRLTISQKYIISRIMDIFGEDVKEIFIFMLTFCDGGSPNIIEQLQNKDCPCQEIIDLLKDSPWYFKFNNSSFFESNREDEYTQLFWKLGIKNFQEFMSRLKSLPRKSLTLTKEVLKERKKLEDQINILNKKLREGLDKIEEIKEIIKIITSLQEDLNDSKNYTKIIKTPTFKKKNKDPNFYATTCIICNKTCHSNCEIADDDEKRKCTSMDSNGYCIYCPKKCRWDQHKNRNYIIEEIMEEKEITLEQLKERYLNSKNKLSLKKQFLQGAKDELITINMDCLQFQELICNSVKKIQEIALNKNKFESDEEFIDLLIEVEKSEHHPDWQNRINNLEMLKEQKKLLREIYQGTNMQLNQIKEFISCDLDKFIKTEK